MLASFFRAVFNNDDFEVCFTLPRKAVQQLLYLVGTVVDWDDKG